MRASSWGRKKGSTAEWLKRRGVRCCTAFNLPSHWSHSVLTRLKSSCSRKKYWKWGRHCICSIRFSLLSHISSVAEAFLEAERSHHKSNSLFQFFQGETLGGRKTTVYKVLCTHTVSVSSVGIFVNREMQCVTDASLTPIYQTEPDWTLTLRKIKTRVGKGNIH